MTTFLIALLVVVWMIIVLKVSLMICNRYQKPEKLLLHDYIKYFRWPPTILCKNCFQIIEHKYIFEDPEFEDSDGATGWRHSKEDPSKLGGKKYYYYCDGDDRYIATNTGFKHAEPPKLVPILNLRT